MTSVVMRETSEEFRKGFEFCTKAIYDLSRQEHYNINMLNDLLSTMITLMNNNTYWSDINKVIIHE